MTLLATIALLIIAAGGTLAYFVCQEAPEGHEDHRGFREYKED